jgi:hypothetical protein
MPFLIAALRRSRSGAYAARKAIPKDVQGTYERLYGQRWEAKFSLPALTRPQDAKARFAAWLAEIEGRITAIRDKQVSDAPAVMVDNPLPSISRPKHKGSTPWILFELWVAAKQPGHSTVNRWRSVFLDLQKRFPTCRINPDEAHAWAEELLNDKRGARTVNDHSPRAIADQYETPTIEDMAEALKEFPRYEIE